MKPVQTKISPLAEKILADRYLWKDREGHATETPDAMFRRVAHAVAKAEGKRAEEWEKKYYAAMSSLDFLPNSPTLMNAGRPHGQLSACFVVGIEDNMESICDALKKQMLIHKSGGGTGFNFSKLRPEGATVSSTSGRASGPVSFMKLFDLSTEVVQQGGARRGANMAILNSDHPDIRKFIHCKDRDGDITNFNLSVGATDQFMKNALRDRTPERALLEEIARHAWQTGDPGLVFLDTMETANPTPQFGKLDTTNPCLRGTMRILTPKGFVPIEDCEGCETDVWNGYEFSTVIPRCTGVNQKMLRVTFSNGSVLDCTPYHHFILNDDRRVEAKDLKKGDKLCRYELPVIPSENETNSNPALRYCEGFYVGDGDRRRNDETDTHVSLYGDKIPLLAEFARFATGRRKESKRLVLTLNAEVSPWNKFFVPDTAYSVKDRLAWLAGYIDSDGSRNSAEGSVSLSAANRELLQRVKDMLATLGVPATLTKEHEAGKRYAPDGHGGKKLYNMRATYRLLISAWYVQKLVRQGLKTYRVDVHGSPNRNAARLITVVSVEPCEDADKVYCLTETRRHAFIAECIPTGNCGEQPLLSGESCNLGSINLVNHLVDNEDGTYTFDWEKYSATVRTATRFLSDVINVNSYPLPEIKTAVDRTRKIGLGIMGYAHALYYLGMEYGSPAALDFLETAMRRLHDEAQAYARGPLNDRPPHMALTCVAPTGTISLIAGVSSGIEPVFSLVHDRDITDIKGAKHTDRIYDPAFDALCANTKWYGRREEQQIQRIFATAHHIPWKAHVDTQAAAQKYSDGGVSKTVNLPHTATERDVYDIYVYAWQKKCKGVTVYRDGTKTTQVLKCPECAVF